MGPSLLCWYKLQAPKTDRQYRYWTDVFSQSSQIPLGDSPRVRHGLCGAQSALETTQYLWKWDDGNIYEIGLILPFWLHAYLMQFHCCHADFNNWQRERVDFRHAFPTSDWHLKWTPRSSPGGCQGQRCPWDWHFSIKHSVPSPENSQMPTIGSGNRDALLGARWYG